MPMTLRKKVISLSIFYLLSLSPAPAQSPTTGRIEGIVKDQNGAVIRGAEVRVTNIATGDWRTVTTDEAGRYTVPLMLPGVYRVSIAAGGFDTAVVDTVRV